MTPFERLPYPGLRAFTRDESDLFFGREDCIDAMVDRLGATRFLAVLGPSGSGKSSLVRTGLLDALDLGLLPQAGTHWRIADLHPGGHPIRKLAEALLAATAEAPPEHAEIARLAAELSAGPRSILRWRSTCNIPDDSSLLILIDQFEELFRYGDYAQREEAEAFVALLLESASARSAPIYVVITMRSEYLGACASISGLAEQISAGLYLTPRMEREQCSEAIQGPASVLGFEVEPALVNRLLNDLGSFAPWEADADTDLPSRLSRQADQLPLMQHVLNRLWLRARSQDPEGAVLLKLSEYDRIGGLSGALDLHGAEIMASLGPSQEGAAESVFRALVSGTSLALAVRRPCRLDELVENAGGDGGSVVAVLEAFRAPDANFIRSSDSDLTGNDVILDISHESLIRQWTPLRNWLEKEIRDGASWRQLISAEERFSQGKGALLREADLVNTLAWWSSANPTAVWAQRHGGRFEPARTFLARSEQVETSARDAERERQKREGRRLLAGIVLLAAALVVTVIFALDASKDLKLATREKEKSDLALKMLADSTNRLKDRERRLEEQKRMAEQARDDARKAHESTAGVLSNVSDLIYSPRYEGLVGLSQLQSEMMKTLGGYQQALLNDGSELNRPAFVNVQDQYRIGKSLQKNGRAGDAMRSYHDAYFVALAAMEKSVRDGERPGEPLTASFLEDGNYYAWYLYDTGEEKQGDRVLQQMESLVDKYGNQDLSERLLVRYGRLQTLKSRYYSNRNQPALGRKYSAAAVAFAKRAMEIDKDPDMDVMTFAETAYRNRSLDLQDKERKDAVAQACKIADRMFSRNPMDRRSILARVDCLRDAAQELPTSNLPKGLRADAAGAPSTDQARKEDPVAAATRIYNEAEEIVYAGLRSASDDQDLLLCLAGLENSLADLSYGGNSQHNAVLNHRIAAINYFTRALKERPFLQANPNQLKVLYENCTRVDFPDEAMEVRYYEDIAEAMRATLETFPHAPSFAFVVANAYTHLGRMLKKDPQRTREAETYLSKAIDLFEKPGAMPDLSSFSEDYYAYCGAYEQRAELYGKTGRPDLMLTDMQTMNGSCKAALQKYPWDIYLRFEFISGARSAGAVLVDLHRYREAFEHLQYASHWGDSDSSLLLARLYREGLGVPRDDQKGKSFENLASRQKDQSYTVSADFGGITSKFTVWIEEWPSDYVKQFPGIDDQVKWLSEARGGSVSPGIVETFRKWQKLASDSNISYPAMCAYEIDNAPSDASDRMKVFEAARKQYAQAATADNLEALRTAANQLMKVKQPSETEAVQKELTEDARMLVKAQPSAASYRVAWDIALSKGDRLKASDPAAAAQAFAWSAELADRLTGDNPEDLYKHVVSYERLGDRASAEGDMEKASRWYAKEFDADRERYALQASAESLQSLNITAKRLCKTLAALDLSARAAAIHQELTRKAEALIKSAPGAPTYRIASDIFAEDGDRLKASDPAGAKQAFERSAQMAELLPDDNADDLDKRVVSDERLADEAEKRGEKQEARSWYAREAAAARQEYLLAGDDADGLDKRRISSQRVGARALEDGKPDEACAWYAKSMEAARQLYKLEATVDNLRRLRTAAADLYSALVTLKQPSQADAVLANLEDSAKSLLEQSQRRSDETLREIGLVYVSLANQRAEAGDSAESHVDFDRGSKLGERISIDTPEGAYDRYLLFERIGDSLLKNGAPKDASSIRPVNARSAYAQAALSLDRYCAFLTASPPRRASEAEDDPYEYFGSLSWLYLLAGDFPKAITAAQTGLKMQPDAKWIEANLAHALLLSGKRQEAMEHYMNARNGSVNQLPLTEVTAKDFQILNSLGFKDPDMDKILTQMKSK